MRSIARSFLSGLFGILVALGCAAIVVTAQSQPVRYVYDELGRLVAVIDGTGAAAIYHYDAVGNLLSITRQNAGVVSILEFSPNTGASGQAVTLYGTGFSATPSQNTVTFNGVAATVTSSTTSQIVTSVPALATTGTIAVTTPSGSATSSSSFTVVASAAPTISSVSPTSGVAGTSVTVTGTNFDTVAARNRLLFNATPAVISAATATSLTTSVPASATSGKVSVSTVNGSVVSTSDFIVAPPPYATSDVLVTDWMTPGTSKTVTIGTAGKIALILFDGVAGQRVSLKIGTGMTSSIKLFNYDHTTLGSVTVGAVEAFIDTVTLTANATYTILVDPVGSATGSLTLTLYDVPADVTGAISAGGSAQTVTTTTPGQNGRLTFADTVGQRISLKVGAGPVGTVTLVGPDRMPTPRTSEQITTSHAGAVAHTVSVAVCHKPVLAEPEPMQARNGWSCSLCDLSPSVSASSGEIANTFRQVPPMRQSSEHQPLNKEKFVDV